MSDPIGISTNAARAYTDEAVLIWKRDRSHLANYKLFVAWVLEATTMMLGSARRSPSETKQKLLSRLWDVELQSSTRSKWSSASVRMAGLLQDIAEDEDKLVRSLFS